MIIDVYRFGYTNNSYFLVKSFKFYERQARLVRAKSKKFKFSRQSGRFNESSKDIFLPESAICMLSLSFVFSF